MGFTSTAGKYAGAALKWAKGVPGSASGVASSVKRWPSSFSNEQLPPGTKALLSRATMGAISGMAVSVPTAAVDRDRSILSGGFVGGAIWGAAAGAAGHAASGALRKAAVSSVANLARGSAGRKATAEGLRGIPRMLRNGSVTGAGLTGAYGLLQFTRGGSRKRKHYTQFHHGEYRDQQQQQQYQQNPQYRGGRR